MNPSLKIGDLVIKSEKLSEEIIADENNGDILILKGPQYFYNQGFNPIFWNNLKNDTVIIHRAIDKKKINNTWFFLTKGDNNLTPDGAYEIINTSDDAIMIQISFIEGIYIPETEIMGIVIIRIPYVGYLKIYFIHILITVMILLLILCILRLFNYKIKVVKCYKN
ncbi:MAG: hypothetical protein KGD57_08015 [Candidatus Lokiarchaeota archaeon]|nr:hypothetical protein [Candidatus Lokiarchaeota archaeon]